MPVVGVDPVDCLVRRVVERVDGPVGGLSRRKRFGGGVGVEGDGRDQRKDPSSA